MTQSIAAAQVIGRFRGGGAERLALNLAAGLPERGVRSYAVALRADGLDAVDSPAGVECIALGADRRRILTVLRAILRFRRLLRTRSIGVVHVHGRDCLVFCAVAMLGLRVPAGRPRLAFTWHSSEGVLSERGLALRLARWSLRRCDRVYGASSGIVDQIIERGGLAAAPAVFRNGVEATETPIAAAPRSSRPVIVWAARLVPPKNAAILVRAAARLRDEGLDFGVVLAGAAPPHLAWHTEELQRLIRGLGLEGVIEMPGWVEDTAELYRSCAIAVQTSRTEGLSLSLLEQMMSGLAIVATDVGDTAAAVQHGRSGLLVPPDDEDALVDALRRVLTDPDLRRGLGAEAGRRAASRFSLRAMATHAAAEYRGLLKGGAGDGHAPVPRGADPDPAMP